MVINIDEEVPKNKYLGNEKEYMKEYYRVNKEKISECKKEYYLNNKEKIRLRQIERKDEILAQIKLSAEKTKKRNAARYIREKERLKILNLEWQKNNKEKIKIKTKEYREKNKEVIYNKIKERCESDEIYKLSRRIRSRIGSILKKKSIIKPSKTEFIIGCSFEELKNHIESQFESWMNWDNHGKWNGELNYGWDIDHIIPLSSSNTKDDIIKLCHYTNLRPLCSHTNRYIKRDKIDFNETT